MCIRNKQKFREKRNFSNYFLSLKSNKKGISQIADIAMGLLLFTMFFIVIMFIAGAAKMQVAATITSENAEFTCRNNLLTLMKYETSAGETYSDLVAKGYIAGDYSEFKTEASNILNRVDVAGPGKWEIIILDSQGFEEVEEELVEKEAKTEKIGEITSKNQETCSMKVPVPCSIKIESECVLDVSMNLGY